MLDLSMACSDSKIYTTWSNLKHSAHVGKTITRHPSGNNNTTPNFLQTNASTGGAGGGGGTGVGVGGGMPIISNKTRCHSLPDLSRVREVERVEMPLNFSVSAAAVREKR